MKKLIFLVWISCLSAHFFTVSSQVPKKRLPRIINMPGNSQYNPSLSGDETYMLFLSTYSISGNFELMEATRVNGDWNKPERVEKIFKGDLDYINGYFVSYDGEEVYFTSRRTPGIGGFDIWVIERKGNQWGIPRNLDKPVNSNGHEGSPSLSPDGKFIYFMRCDKISHTSKEGCKIMVAEKSGRRFQEPRELPAPVNLGHETQPRILADNQTLIFASNRPGGKGNMDLYLSRLENGTWSAPLPMDFANNERDNEFASVPIRGDIMYYSLLYRDYLNIVMARLPEAFQPKGVLLLEGKVLLEDTGAPADAAVQAYDAITGEKIQFTTTDEDGSFFFILPEGRTYDFSIYPADNRHSFYSALYDLQTMPTSEREKLDLSLKPLQSGAILDLNVIRYRPYTDLLLDESAFELRRIARLMQKNPDLKFEVAAYIDTLYTDSIQSSPDLTETTIDTVFFDLSKIPEEMAESTDSLDAEDSLAVEMVDSLALAEREMLLNAHDSIQSAGYALFAEEDEKIIYYRTNTTFHNDRTQGMAEAIVRFLIDKGAPETQITGVGYGEAWQKNKAAEERNYWIEMRVVDAISPPGDQGRRGEH